jgi:hypothetical protein
MLEIGGAARPRASSHSNKQLILKDILLAPEWHAT